MRNVAPINAPCAAVGLGTHSLPAEPHKLTTFSNPKAEARRQSTSQWSGRSCLALGERRYVTIRCGHREEMEETRRGQSSVVFHTIIWPRLNEKQRMLLRRHGGSAGWWENIRKTNGEKICLAKTSRSPAWLHWKECNDILRKSSRFHFISLFFPLQLEKKKNTSQFAVSPLLTKIATWDKRWWSLVPC